MKLPSFIHANILFALLTQPITGAPVLITDQPTDPSESTEFTQANAGSPEETPQGYRDENQLDASQKHVDCVVEEYAIPVWGKVAWNFEMNVTGWGHGGPLNKGCGSGIEDNLRSSCSGAALRLFECEELENNKLMIRFQTAKVHTGQCIDKALHRASYKTWSPKGAVCPFHYGLSIGREVGTVVTWFMLVIGIPWVRSSSRTTGWLKGLSYTAVLVVANNAFDNWDRWFKSEAKKRKVKLEAKSDSARREKENPVKQTSIPIVETPKTTTSLIEARPSSRSTVQSGISWSDFVGQQGM